MLTLVGACGVDIEKDHGWEQAWDRLAIQDRDQTDQTETEQLRQQLAKAEERAAQASREADALRRQVVDTQEPERTRPAAKAFWSFLDPTEREVLRAVADVRAFAAGATIMQQGEPADYVLVILGGKASIRVNENGKERVIAERGQGQLIGERAALQVSVRSANVVVLEMIWALVVQTKDFAAFLSTYPHIREFVEEQRHDRGTDEPGSHIHSGPTDFTPPIDSTSTGQPIGTPSRYQQALRGENCTVVITDVVAFGARKRTAEDRLIIREALSDMTQAATQGLGGARAEDRGDGILIVIPPNVPTTQALDQLLLALPDALHRHNNNQHNPAQIQLRLAIDVGPVVSDTMGVSGEALIAAARLVEAPAFKEAFVGSTACLGIIVSQFVYDTVIKQSRDQDYVTSYSKVAVEVKEFHTTAWMKLIN